MRYNRSDHDVVSGATAVTVSGAGVTTGAVNVTSPSSLTVTSASIASISLLDPVSNTPVSEITVNEGNSIQPQVRIVDNADAVRNDVVATLSSTNPEIATAGSTGTIQGLKAGFSTATIAAESAVATATITVVQVLAGAGALDAGGIVQDASERLYFAATSDHTIRTADSLQQAPQVYAGVSGSPGLFNALRLQALTPVPVMDTLVEPATKTLT